VFAYTVEYFSHDTGEVRLHVTRGATGICPSNPKWLTAAILKKRKNFYIEGSPTEHHADHGGSGNQVDGVGGSSLATGAELPPTWRPKSDSNLDPSLWFVVCPSPVVRLVIAPTLAAAHTARSGRLVETPTLA